MRTVRWLNLDVTLGKPKIVAFGDSLTAGFGLTENESYPYLLQQKLKADGYDYEVVNAGVSGDTSHGGLERIDWVLGMDNVKILILELGANDLLRGIPVARMRANLDQIITRHRPKVSRCCFAECWRRRRWANNTSVSTQQRFLSWPMSIRPLFPFYT